MDEATGGVSHWSSPDTRSGRPPPLPTHGLVQHRLPKEAHGMNRSINGFVCLLHVNNELQLLFIIVCLLHLIKVLPLLLSIVFVSVFFLLVVVAIGASERKTINFFRQ